MDNKQYRMDFEALCAACGLGALCAEPTPLKGGLLHRMYAVETSSGKYAVKALNPQVMLRPKAMSDILNGERIAAIASAHIPALTAKQYGGTVMQEIDGQYYLLYNWVEGSSLYGDAITCKHCEQIGSILGTLHGIDFSALHLSEPPAAKEDVVDWEGYVSKGKQANAVWAEVLAENLGNLQDWNTRYLAAMQYLQQPLVIGHGDIDPKNVMWHNNQPIAIDWESAGYLHPCHELFVYALSWANAPGVTDKDKFIAFLRGYLGSNPFDVAAVDWSLVANAGLSPHWLEYSLKRSLGIECADTAEQQMGTEQVLGTIDYLKRYDASIHEIVGWLAMLQA